MAIKHGTITRELISSFLSRLDVRVSRIELREEAEGFVDVKLVSLDRSGHGVALSLANESDGTRKLFALATLVDNGLASRFDPLLDELQNGLHPKALLALLELFKSPKIDVRMHSLS